MEIKSEEHPEPSEELKLMLEKPPGWFSKSGLLLLLSFFFIVLLFCWFGRYPDSIAAEIKLVSSNARMKVVSKTGGRVKFLVTEGSFVQEDQFLGIIHPAVNRKDDVLGLIRKLDILYTQDPGVIFADTVSFDEFLFIEEIQLYYDDFLRKRRDYLTHFSLKPHHQKKKELAVKLKLSSDLKLRRKAQLELIQKKTAIEKHRVSIAERLFEQKVIASSDLENARELLLDKQQAEETARELLQQLDLNEQEIQMSINELDIKIIEDSVFYRGNMLDAFKLLFSKVREWENMHLVRAPADGIVYYGDFWSSGQAVMEGEEVLSILPKDEDIFAIAEIPFERSGEVKATQPVYIYLTSYLSEEYGILKGEVKSISPVPHDTAYRVLISLPNGLVTSYGREIPFQPELHGKAEIITRNSRIIEKIFYKFRRMSENFTP